MNMRNIIGITDKSLRLGITIRMKASPPQSHGFLPLDRAIRTVHINTRVRATYSAMSPTMFTLCRRLYNPSLGPRTAS